MSHSRHCRPQTKDCPGSARNGKPRCALPTGLPLSWQRATLTPIHRVFRMDLAKTDSLTIDIADLVNVGVFLVDADMHVLIWNRFMELHSGRDKCDVLG